MQRALGDLLKDGAIIVPGAFDALSARLAVRAGTMMTGYACGTLAMNRVILRVDPANQAGVALAEAAGFSLTAADPVIRERRGRRETLLTWSHGTTG